MSTYAKFQFDHTTTTAAEEAAMRRRLVAEAEAAGWTGISTFAEWFDECVSYFHVEGDAPRVVLLGEWGYGEFDASVDDAAEAAWQRRLALQAEGWNGLTITDEPDTMESGTYRLRGTPPPWDGAYNGGHTAEGSTVHAVFARDGAGVAAKVLELSASHADNGRKSAFAHLPGWVFSECANVITAEYRGGDEEYKGRAWAVPIVRWYDPAWGRRGGKVEYSAAWRYAHGACQECGGEVAYGTCQRCGAY